jgi:hypothetical protein
MMPDGGSYIVEPHYDINHRNGVSTLDILIIQRHLLNLQPLTSPYQHIAADANRNGQLSASDLVDIRKIVLELIDVFPSNTSWRFVDFEQVFVDPNAPLNETIDEQYLIPSLTTHMDIDFIGVKIGDVNNSVIMNADQSSTEVRGAPLTIGYSKSPNGFDITTTTGVAFNGLQTTLVFDQEVTAIESSLPGFGEDQYVIDGNTVKISYTASGETLDLVANQALFEVSTSSKTMELSSEGLRSEVYTGSSQIEVQPIVLENKNDKIIPQMSNQPNPWSQSTQLVILTPTASDISITFTNELGQVIYVLETSVVKGINKIQVTNDILQTNGMIYYKTNIGPQQINGSMMIIE